MSIYLFRYIGCTNDGMGLGATLPAIINIIIIATNPQREVFIIQNCL